MLFRTIRLAAALIIAGTATLAASPQTATLIQGLRRGDVFEATRTLTIETGGTTTTDTGECHVVADSVTLRDRYTELVASGCNCGKPTEVRRCYIGSTLTRALKGSRSKTTSRSLSGKTVILAESGPTIRVCECKGIAGSDQEDLRRSSIDQFADLLPGNPCAPGDRWPISDRFFRQFAIEGPACGICTFEGMVSRDGAEFARIGFSGTQLGVDERGCQYELVLDGYMLWSPALRRPVYMEYRAPTSVRYTTQIGATVSRYTGSKVCTLTLGLKWPRAGRTQHQAGMSGPGAGAVKCAGRLPGQTEPPRWP